MQKKCKICFQFNILDIIILALSAIISLFTGDIDLEGNYHIDLRLYLTILLAKIRDLGHLDLEGY